MGLAWRPVAPEPTTLDGLLGDLEAEHRDLDLLVTTLDDAVLAMTDLSRFQALVAEAMAGSDPMAEHLRRGRDLSGAEILSWWRASREAMVAATIELPEGARVPWFGPPMGVLSFVSARLMETWAHGQDVADALDRRRLPTGRLRHIAHLGVRT